MVELLVVIGVIAVMMAILLPAMRRVRNAAVTSTCLAQLRQVGIFVQLYASDHAGVIPQGYHEGRRPSSGSWDAVYWTTFYGYSKQFEEMVQGTFRCPKNQPTPATGNCYAFISKSTSKKGEFSIRPYGNYLPSPNESFTFLGIRLTKLRQASSYVLAVDSATQSWTGVSGLRNLNNPPAAQWFKRDQLWTGGNQWGVWMAHMNAANLLFGDGHSERCDAKQMKLAGVTGYWDYYGKSFP